MNEASPARVLAELVRALPDALFVSTCGYLSRDLQQVGDGPNFFYLVGSMGAALPVGLALARCAQRERVVVIDGDGSFLMGMNCLPLVGAQAPANLVHVVMDNGMHESTGGQQTAGNACRGVTAAMSAGGYPHALLVEDVADPVVREALGKPGPTGIHLPIAPREAIAPRIAPEPEELVRRTRKLIANNRSNHPGEVGP
ncbi:MAG: phosphonopyruvate decarboxylase [Pseudonocardiaceae bacterium]|nr:phosphonopyruvate decarboxylase [Pseudonocardiaceae bacterium]